MSGKTLTATVKFNTRSAEASLTRLAKKINNVQNAVNKTSKNISKVTTETNKATRAANKQLKTNEQLARKADKIANSTRKVKTANDRAATSAQRLASGYRASNTAASRLATTVRRLESTYLGVMGGKALLSGSDTITSTENRLNNLEGGSPEKTAQTMDKIYAASQRVRTGYSDMLSNVSKTMTLAGDAFKGNVDNAIKFQEIMAMSYTVGGASAAEQASSMYQLVQALGSGILQGDELRSVREGAPLAYKAIEEFAQGVYNTEESLKELASQGKITSDMVVAAIMDSEGKITESFNNTSMTFAQAWTSIKNMALQAFKPVLQKLNELLNSDAGQKLIKGIGSALVWFANALLWIIDVTGAFFNWCAENWDWLKFVIIGVLTVIITYYAIVAAKAIWTAMVNAWAWLQAYWPLLLIVAGIMAILYVYDLWRQGTITTTEAICYCLIIIAVIFVIVAAIMTAGVYLIIAAVILGLALIIMYFSEVCGGIMVGLSAIWNAIKWLVNVILAIVYSLLAIIWDIIAGIVNFIVGCAMFIYACVYDVVAAIVNVAMGLWNVISAVCQNIGIAFSNAWYGALSAFWEFIADCVDGLNWLAKPLDAIAKLFGKSFNLDSFSADLHAKADNYSSKQRDYVSISDAWNKGMNTMQYKNPVDEFNAGMKTMDYYSLGDAWNAGYNTLDAFESGWASDAYKAGSEWGQGIEDSINKLGSKYQDGTSLLDSIGSSLGLDKITSGSGLPNVNDPAYALNTDTYDPSGLLGEIKDDTSDIKDGMNLSRDDMDYLRKLAEMEWRNEFTTAEIKVDMTNYNSVRGEPDLDGIVEYLSDTLRSEMHNVAYGVHY